MSHLAASLALRITKPEEEVEQLSKSLETTRQKSDALVEALQAENESLRKRLEGGGAVAPVAQRADESAELARRCRVLELLTGLTVTFEQEGRVARCACSVGAEKAARTVEFKLDLEGEDGDVDYTPTQLGDLEERLPDYLREPIAFEKAQAPEFMQKVLAAVSSQE